MTPSQKRNQQKRIEQIKSQMKHKSKPRLKLYLIIISLGVIITWALIYNNPQSHESVQTMISSQSPTQTKYVSTVTDSSGHQSTIPQVLTPILDRYPGLTASQAADLYFRISGSNAPGFNFGSNTGNGKIPQFDQTQKVVSLSNNPVNLAYQNYISSSPYNPGQAIPPSQLPSTNTNPINISFTSLLNWMGII